MKHALSFLIGAALCSVPAQAFSLLGEAEGWQETQLSYLFDTSGDLGAPKNLGEEYRWSTPVVTYGFDASFVDYFGEDGMDAIDAAFAILNDVPAASAMSPTLTEFPLNVRRVNRNAERLGMIDLKTQCVGAILEQMGLGIPERYCWTLRDAIVRDTDPWQAFNVINYNFDPVTYKPSPYVNGTLYSYSIFSYLINDTRHYDALDFRVDPSQPNVTASAFGNSAGLVDDAVLFQTGTSGAFLERITRDDAGSIRYLYSPQNRNYELAPTGTAIQGTTFGTSVGSGGAGGGGSPWTPVIITAPTGGAVTDPNAGGGATNAGPVLVTAGVRSGVDKVSFTRVDLDPILRRIATPLLVRYTETVTTTNGVVNQRVERLLTVPDIIISAGNLNQGSYARSMTFINNAAIDGISTLANGGPGNLEGTQEITFNNAGRIIQNQVVGSRQVDGFLDFVWGSFDGSTNAPVTYPQGRYTFAELQELAQRGLIQP